MDLPESEQHMLIDGRKQRADAVTLDRSLGRALYDGAKVREPLPANFASQLLRWTCVPAGSAKVTRGPRFP
jgi:hypothetical protein